MIYHVIVREEVVNLELNENDLILGCDPSLNSTGICIINGKGNIVHVESFNPQPINSYDRLNYNYSRYNSILSSFNIKYVGFEKQLPQERYNFNAKNILSLAENLGILKLALCRYGNILGIYEFLATEIKKHATGNSKADKLMMEDALGVRVKNNIKSNIVEGSVNDVVDAYWAAKITLSELNGNVEKSHKVPAFSI